MRRISGIAFLASAWLLLGPSARADLQLGITANFTPGVIYASSVTASLMANQPATFDVVLSGLDEAGGRQLSGLGVTVAFDTSLGPPTSISPGAIIPDPNGFLPIPGDPPTISGLADASYDSVFTDPAALIMSNGVFFSFTVDPPADGPVTFAITYGVAFDASDPDTSIQILPLNAVPEPSSVLVVCFAGGVIGLRQGSRWLRARRVTRMVQGLRRIHSSRS